MLCYVMAVHGSQDGGDALTCALNHGAGVASCDQREQAINGSTREAAGMMTGARMQSWRGGGHPRDMFLEAQRHSRSDGTIGEVLHAVASCRSQSNGSSRRSAGGEGKHLQVRLLAAALPRDHASAVQSRALGPPADETVRTSRTIDHVGNQ